MKSQYQLGSGLLEIRLGDTVRVDQDFFDIGPEFNAEAGRHVIAGENIRPKPIIRTLYETGNEVVDADFSFWVGGPDGCIIYPGGLYYLLADRPVGNSIERLNTRALDIQAIQFHFYEIHLAQLWLAVTVPYPVHIPKNLLLGHVLLEDGFGD